MALVSSKARGTPRGRAGKVKDPLFILMVVAMTLAVISSIALRAFVPGIGPSSARAETPDEGPAVLGPLRHPPATMEK